MRVDTYPPTPEIVLVAPSFEESRLRTGGASLEPGEAVPEGPQIVIDSGAARPVLVQLRPSTLVVLDNAAR